MSQKKRLLLAIVSVLMVVLAGIYWYASTSHWKRFKVAESLMSRLDAVDVKVGPTFIKDSVFGDRKLLSLNFEGVGMYWSVEELQYISGLVAYEFVQRLDEWHLGDDTLIGIHLALDNGNVCQFEFALKDLNECDSLLAVTKHVVGYYVDGDTAGVRRAADLNFFGKLSDISMCAAYNDSVYKDADRNPELAGLDFSTVKSGKWVDVFRAIYTESDERHITRYILSIDRKTRKIIGGSIETKALPGVQ